MRQDIVHLPVRQWFSLSGPRKFYDVRTVSLTAYFNVRLENYFCCL